MSSLQPVIIDDGDLNDIQYQPADLWVHQQGQNYHGSTFSAGFTGATSQFTFNGASSPCRATRVSAFRHRYVLFLDLQARTS